MSRSLLLSVLLPTMVFTHPALSASDLLLHAEESHERSVETQSTSRDLSTNNGDVAPVNSHNDMDGIAYDISLMAQMLDPTSLELSQGFKEYLQLQKEGGDAEVLQHTYRAMQTEWTRLLEDDPDNPYLLAQLHDAKRGEEYVDTFRKLAEFDRVFLQLAEATHGRVGELYKRSRFADGIKPTEAACFAEALILGSDHWVYADSLHNLAGLHRLSGNLQRARQFYLKSLTIKEAVYGVRHPSYIESLHYLARVYQDLGEFDDAERLYTQTLELYESLYAVTDVRMVDPYASLARFRLVVGDSIRAFGFLEKAEGIIGAAEEVGVYVPPDSSAQVWSTFGHYFLAINEPEKAGRYFQQAVCQLGPDAEPQRGTPPHYSVKYATALHDLAAYFEATKQCKKAAEVLDEAAAIEAEVFGRSHPRYATTLHNLGGVYFCLGKYSDAQEHYEAALSLREGILPKGHPSLSHTQVNLGALMVAKSDVKAGIELIQTGLTQQRTSLELAALAQSERQQRVRASWLRASLDFFLTAAQISGQLSASDTYQQVLNWKGSVLYRQRLNRAVVRKPDIVGIARELGDNARELSALVSYEPDTHGQQAWLDRIEKLTDEKERLESKIAGAIDLDTAGSQMMVSDVLETLYDGTVLLDFVIYMKATMPSAGGGFKREKHLAAFVLKPGKPVVRVELGRMSPIDCAATIWLDHLIKGGDGYIDDESRASDVLKAQLWSPLQKYLVEGDTVLISPDGILAMIPWNALPGQLPGTYLIQEHSIALMPSSRLIPTLLGPKDDDSGFSALLVGDVYYDASPATSQINSDLTRDGRSSAANGSPSAAISDFSFSRLRQSGDQIDKILSLGQAYCDNFKPNDLRKLEATEDAFRRIAPASNLIHLATHAFYRPTQPSYAGDLTGTSELRSGLFADKKQILGFHPDLLSGFALTGANVTPTFLDNRVTDNGVVYALELAGIDLQNAELVVLSACQTGVGSISIGEGLIGLQRSFHMGGADSVVATLWEVDVASSTALMESFYYNLWQHDMGPLQALRQAQLDRISDDRSAQQQPILWAGFVLSGAPGRQVALPTPPVPPYARWFVSGIILLLVAGVGLGFLIFLILRLRTSSTST